MVDEIRIGIVQVYHTAAVTLGASLIALGLAIFTLSPTYALNGFYTAVGGIILIIIPTYLAEWRIKKAR